MISKNRSNTYQIFLLIFCVISLTSTTILKAVKAEDYLAVTDLSKHPVYSKYKFDNTDRVINIGVQPLYLPTGLITESMKRDHILSENLLTNGLKVRYYPFLKGSDGNYFLQRGDIDIAVGGDMPAITAAAFADIVIPVMIQYGFTSLVANSPFLISELAGRKIGCALGSNAHYALLRALSSAGVSKEDVDIVFMEVSQMPTMLLERKIDAFYAWEPIPTVSLNDYSDVISIHKSLSYGFMYFEKTFVEKYPEAVMQILAAEIRALRWIQNSNQNVFQAAEWAQQATEDLTKIKSPLTTKQYVALAKNDIISLTTVPIIPAVLLRKAGQLNNELKFLQTLNIIPASIEWESIRDCFDDRFVKEVITSPGKYRINEFHYLIESKKDE